jgi:glycosyltransferase involved in cell wall biosynthesis
MGPKCPIFAIGPVIGDANKLIFDSNCGVMVDYNVEAGAYKLLQQIYNEWKENNSKYTYNVEQFSRKNLTKKLAEVFEEVIKIKE